MLNPGHRAVFLCVNHDRSYIALAYQAISSIRRFNPNIPIVLFVEESATASIKRNFSFEGLRIEQIPTAYDRRYVMKWDCVARMANMPYGPACYLDIDTVCYRDIAELFDHCAHADFAGRREPQTQEGGRDCQVDFGKYRLMLERHYAEPRPVFNVGVMTMSHRFMSFMRDQRFFLTRLVDEYAREPDLYPARNRHIVDQFCLSIMLGTRPDLATQTICPDISPYFAEFSLLGKRDPGVVLHYWNQFASLKNDSIKNDSLKSANPYADADGSRPAPDPKGVLP